MPKSAARIVEGLELLGRALRTEQLEDADAREILRELGIDAERLAARLRGSSLTPTVEVDEPPQFSATTLDLMERDGWTPQQVRALIADYRRLYVQPSLQLGEASSTDTDPIEQGECT